MSTEFDSNLIIEFVAESREHLDQIEPDLLAMEEEGQSVSQEMINSVFRAIHSIKGGAGFFAFESLKQLSHVMESVLMRVRDGELGITTAMMDVLLNGVDKLRAMIDDIQASDTVPVAEDLKLLEGLLKGDTKDDGAVAETIDEGQTSSPVSLFDLDSEAVHKADRQGFNIYVLEVMGEEDLVKTETTPAGFLTNAESMGVCLECSVERDALPASIDDLPQDFAFSILYASVLELSLMPGALVIDEEHVTQVDVKKEEKAEVETPAEVETAHPSLDKAAPAAEEVSTQKAPQAASAAKGDLQGGETLRVRVDLLTRLMNTAGELVLGRNQLLQALENHSEMVPGLAAILQNVDLVTTEMQESIMQTRMQPIGAVFGRFARVARDMARKLGKEIELQVEGADVELDKSIIELLVDPLTHIVRNSADHGIETPEVREKAGKPAKGTVLLRAYHESGQVNILIRDDGAGIDTARVLNKAVEKGVIQEGEAAKLGEREIISLVFEPGFSTAEVISDVSGRGVGMDVVKTNIEKLGGHISIDAELGKGTTVLMRLPLTLAIVPSLIIGVEEHRFAVPQVNLVELVWVRAAEVAKRIESVHGADVLRLRGRLLPLIKLADLLGIQTQYQDPETGETMASRRERVVDRRGAPTAGGATEGDAEGGGEFSTRTSDRRTNWHGDYNILVLRVGSNQFGVIVSELFDSEEIVVKPLSLFIKGCRLFAGSTILGDGRVIMILDAAGLMNAAGLHFTDLEEEEKQRIAQEEKRALLAAESREAVVLFKIADDEIFAVSQDRILRLERINMTDVQVVGGREFIEYRGSGLPLVRIEQYLDVQGPREDVEQMFLIIPKETVNGEVLPAQAGIMASSIVDAMEVEVKIEDSGLKGPGLKGAAIVNNRLTLFIEPDGLLKAAGI